VSADLQSAMRATRAQVDARLEALLVGGPPRLLDAMRYAVLGPGKRLRPILCLWAHEMLDGRCAAAALDAACALELVHTYSLVHDDLPCMDDDALRRGRPTCHVVYGEALAVLVGDALLDLAFDVVLGAPWDDPAVALCVAHTLADAASHRGLVGGQVLDLEAAGAQPTAAQLQAIHAAKTGALLQAALLCGAHAARASEADVATLRQAGRELGLAFQIADDVLDVVGDAVTLGKSPGKDAAEHKMTYPALYGVERSRALALEHAARAQAALGHWPGSEKLQALALYLVQRTG
jgi:geranylgeranyl diphosphate synthase, type II